MKDKDKWDRRFLALARGVAAYSHDPSTQTGAVIVDDQGLVMATGYNGFPIGVNDDPKRYADRPLKYELVVHCETNAIVLARRDLRGCTLYTWPFMSCSRCAGVVIQAGIKRCVAPVIPARLVERWSQNMALSTMMFAEAGVELCLLEDVEGAE